MNYNFSMLTPETFENLIQSLSRKILGDGLIVFGCGADGGREAVFEGKAHLPGKKECWQGKWIVQAKFKSREDNKNNFNWIKKEFEQEMGKSPMIENRKDLFKLV